jgi:hypothetical protein
MNEVADKEQGALVVPDQPYSKRGEAMPALAGQPTNLMQALAAAAADPRMDVDKVERLYAMHKEMMEREAKAEFNDAMAKAQAEMQPVANNAFNDHTRSGYAKLEAIDRAITPIHTKYGLSVSYDTETKNEADPIPEGMLRTVAIVAHPGGHERRHHLDLPPDDAGTQGTKNKTGVQARGSTSAYARRYLKLMVFNLSTFDDKDGNSGGRNGGKTMDEGAIADSLAKMDEATNEADLMKFFGTAWNAAEEIKDKNAQRVFMTKRDERRKALKVALR